MIAIYFFNFTVVNINALDLLLLEQFTVNLLAIGKPSPYAEASSIWWGRPTIDFNHRIATLLNVAHPSTSAFRPFAITVSIFSTAAQFFSKGA